MIVRMQHQADTLKTPDWGKPDRARTDLLLLLKDRTDFGKFALRVFID